MFQVRIHKKITQKTFHCTANSSRPSRSETMTTLVRTMTEWHTLALTRQRRQDVNQSQFVDFANTADYALPRTKTFHILTLKARYALRFTDI